MKTAATASARVQPVRRDDVLVDVALARHLRVEPVRPEMLLLLLLLRLLVVVGMVSEVLWDVGMIGLRVVAHVEVVLLGLHLGWWMDALVRVVGPVVLVVLLLLLVVVKVRR